MTARTDQHEDAPGEASEIVSSARELASLARDLGPTTEAGSELAPELLAALRAGDMFQLGVPRELGGVQAAPHDTLAAVEALARGDASTGWCVGIAATSGLNAAYLPAQGASEVFAQPGTVPAGVWAPKGVGRPVGGGVVLSGQWSFCSGITHSDWLFAGFKLDVGGAGKRPLRVAALPRAELQILDTWHTTGLRGTGSRDAVAHEVFVPDHRTFSLLDGPPADADALYRFPVFGYFALSVAAAALGNAQGALDDALAVAAHRRSSGSADARRVLAERPTAQRTIAEAEASVRAARALVFRSVEDAWRITTDGGTVPLHSRMALRLAATHAGQTARRTVASLYDLAGSTAIYDSSSLQRRFRDAHTASAHVQLNADSWELSGGVLLGVDTPTELV